MQGQRNYYSSTDCWIAHKELNSVILNKHIKAQNKIIYMINISQVSDLTNSVRSQGTEGLC